MRKFKDMSREKIAPFKQNRLLYIDQKKLYGKLNRVLKFLNIITDAEESRRLWIDIWSAKKGHNREAAWTRRLQNERNRHHFQQPG